MKTHTHHIILGLSLGLLSLGLSPESLWSLNLAATPEAGAAMPMGGSADSWLPGWTAGIELVTPYSPRLSLGGRIGLQRWKPDVQGMLSLNGHRMHIEDDIGWSITGDISGLARYLAYDFQQPRISVWLQGSLGIAYQRSSDVIVRGYYTAGETAVNRYIFKPARTDIAPVGSIGLSLLWWDVFEPALRFQKVFSTDGLESLVLSLRLMKR
ncbi:MAG: hypothetical protein V2A61_02970 [Calditrichota bacterium]